MGMAEGLSGKHHPGVNSGNFKAGGEEATIIHEYTRPDRKIPFMSVRLNHSNILR